MKVQFLEQFFGFSFFLGGYSWMILLLRTHEIFVRVDRFQMI